MFYCVFLSIVIALPQSFIMPQQCSSPEDTRHEKVPQRINNHQTPMKMWRDLFMFDQYFEKFDLAPEVTAALKKCKCIAYAETKAELEEMAYGPTHTSRYDVV